MRETIGRPAPIGVITGAVSMLHLRDVVRHWSHDSISHASCIQNKCGGLWLASKVHWARVSSWRHKMMNHRIVSFLGRAAIGIALTLTVSCNNQPDLCAQAADHVNACTGDVPVAAANCNETLAHSLLAQSCDELANAKRNPGKADWWSDLLCSWFGWGCPPPTCTSLGGQCLTSPSDSGFGAHCELEYGAEELDGTCQAINQSCCTEPPINACEQAGGSCHFGLLADCGAGYELAPGLGCPGSIASACCTPIEQTCDDDQDCVACAYRSAPSGPNDDCSAHCPFCDVSATTRDECNSRRRAFEAFCGEAAQVCPIPSCPPTAPHGGAFCADEETYPVSGDNQCHINWLSWPT